VERDDAGLLAHAACVRTRPVDLIRRATLMRSGDSAHDSARSSLHASRTLRAGGDPPALGIIRAQE